LPTASRGPRTVVVDIQCARTGRLAGRPPERPLLKAFPRELRNEEEIVSAIRRE